MLAKNPQLKYTVMGGGRQLGELPPLVSEISAETFKPERKKTKKELAQEKREMKKPEKAGLQAPSTKNDKRATDKEKERKPKYRNKKVYVFVDGFISYDVADKAAHGAVIDKFDSVKEFERYGELQLLAKNGQISELKRQVPYIIQEKFKYEGKTIRAIVYNADYEYIENGKTVVEDVKGIDRKTQEPICTKDFKLKWKLLKFRYPEVTFRIF